MSHNENKAVLIFGPTAVGKTQLLHSLVGLDGDEPCASFQCSKHVEVVSADSRQIYQDIKIASAYPSDDILKKIPHHLVGMKSSLENYNVFDFVQEAEACIENINRRGNIPLVVGGTAFYLYNLWKGTPQTPAVEDTVRASLQNIAQEKGQEYMYQWLCDVDMASAQKVYPNDQYRTLRVLEVFVQTGKALSSFVEHHQKNDAVQYHIYGLKRERSHLYERINARVDAMLQQGLLHEVYMLWLRNISLESNVIKTIGVQELMRDEEVRACWERQRALAQKEAMKLPSDILERVVSSIKQNSRRYAKRQMTFFKRFDNITWIDLDELESEHRTNPYYDMWQEILENAQ